MVDVLDETRRLAIAFMRKPPTEREHIAQTLGVGDDLPERHPAASLVILQRISERGLVDDLRRAVYGRSAER